MAKIVFTSNVTDITTKVRKNFKPTEDGYHWVIGGALGIYNESSEYYLATDAIKALFKASSVFMKKVEGNKVYGEVNHPTQLPGESDVDFAKRWLAIDMTKAIAFIKDIEIADKPIKIDSQTEPVYPIWLKVKPFGPYKGMLEQSLNDPDINTSFSIRCLSKKMKVSMRTVRRIFYVITFDFVDIPGISLADKNNTVIHKDNLTAESFEVEIDDIELKKIYEAIGNDGTITKEDKEVFTEVLNAYNVCDDNKCIYSGW